MGRRASRCRAQAGGARERSASGAAAVAGGRTRARDVACAARAATQSACIPDGSVGAGSRRPARPSAFPHPPFLRAARSPAFHRRSRRQTCPFERGTRCRHPRRPLREGPFGAARAPVGRSLARSCTANTAGGAKRARLRAREFQEARASRVAHGNGSVFVRRLVRRLARMAAGVRPSAAIRRERSGGTVAPHARRVTAGGQRSTHMARAHRLAASRTRQAGGVAPARRAPRISADAVQSWLNRYKRSPAIGRDLADQFRPVRGRPANVVLVPKLEDPVAFLGTKALVR